MANFETNILYCCNFDICGYYTRTLNFYHNCWTYINRDNKPKFSIFNKIPQLYCQYYPGLLENLTFAKKAVIARTYTIITILKLKTNNSFNLGLYKDICKYFVLLPQNPEPLFNLFLLEITFVNNIIEIV